MQRTNAPGKKRECRAHPNGRTCEQRTTQEPNHTDDVVYTEMIMHRMSCRQAVDTLCFFMSLWFSTLHATRSRAYVCRIIRQCQCDRQTVLFFSFRPILLCIGIASSYVIHTHTAHTDIVMWGIKNTEYESLECFSVKVNGSATVRKSRHFHCDQSDQNRWRNNVHMFCIWLLVRFGFTSWMIYERQRTRNEGKYRKER